ncbi:MAG: NUDIX hydrolase [Candidatus Wildermuthbacteria bacterium]|nr:NUDIX hydrolase [Candidatus Wildermuthbacteria bacterium]
MVSFPILPISVVAIQCRYPRCSKKGELGLVLVKESKEWKLPGGKQEQGETSEQCAIREVREETGIKLGPADLTLLEVSRQYGGYEVTYFIVRLEQFPSLKNRKLRASRSREPHGDATSANIFPIWTIRGETMRGGKLNLSLRHVVILRTHGII